MPTNQLRDTRPEKINLAQFAQWHFHLQNTQFLYTVVNSNIGNNERASINDPIYWLDFTFDIIVIMFTA